ncbi:MAG: enhanced serine sensitivity protein SseB C-terminal domain-containing protein, partial [Ruminococcus sp.]
AAFRKKSTQETELPMIDALFRSQVIAPVQLINAEQDLNMEDGEKHQTQIKFVMVQNNDKKFFPAFTDMEELNRWQNPPEYRTMIIPFLQYAAMFQQNGDAEGIVVNPFREGESVAMPKANVIDLAKRFVHYQRQQQQNRVQLFDLKDKPIDLMKELSAHFEEVPEVHAAYMTGMRVGNKESVMLVLDCDQVEDTKSLFQPAAQIVNRHTNGNPPGIITTQHDMSKSILERTTPFYQE